MGSDLYAQNKKVTVSNVQMEIKEEKVIINYDILKSSKKDLFDIEIDFITNDLTYIYPKTLRGDIGSNIQGGNNKQIVWDIRNDEDILLGSIRPNMYLNDVVVGDKFGGPYNALLSLLVPGLGDYRVYDHRQMSFKPHHKMAIVIPSMVLGVLALNNREETSYWISPRTETKWRWDRMNQAYYPEHIYHEGRWSDGETDYWLFRGDAEFFLCVGGAIWALDVFWVALKGAENKIRYNNKMKEQNKLSLKATGTNISLAYRF